MTSWTDYQDDISDAISDSMDVDWSANDGARAVVRWLNENKPLSTTPRVTVPEAKVYIDCEFDGHGGPLLSMALVRDDGRSIYLCVPDEPMTLTSWVKENVWPLVHMSLPVGRTVAFVNDWGPLVRSFLGNEAPIIIADSPVDIGRFCAVLSTGADGGWASTDYPRVTCEVHNVDCYPTGLPSAVQHNAWWDAMALREALRPLISAAPAPEGGAAHYGDPCVKCGVGHDDVSPGPCRDDGITISRERANALLSYLKNGRGPAGWPTTLWCEVQAFIKNIEAALATREEAPAEVGVAAKIIACHLPVSDAPDTVCLPITMTAGDLRTVYAALRAQPPAREDAQPVAWKATIAPETDPDWPEAREMGSKVFCVTRPDGQRHSVIAVDANDAVMTIRELHPYTHPAPDQAEQGAK